MAFPVDAARAATNVSTAIDPITLTLPAGVVAGDLLIAFFRISTNTVVSLTGWTQLALDSSDASDDQTGVYWRAADGADPVSLDVSANTKGGAIIWRITGAANPATRAPEISAVRVGTTTANTCQPNTITPTGGSKDYLFLVCGGEDGEVGAFTGAPTNYTNLQAANSGTGAAAATNVLMGGASRQLTAASDSPGVFTHAAATNGWTAFAVAVHPPAAAAFIEAPSIIAEQAVMRSNVY